MKTAEIRQKSEYAVLYWETRMLLLGVQVLTPFVAKSVFVVIWSRREPQMQLRSFSSSSSIATQVPQSCALARGRSSLDRANLQERCAGQLRRLDFVSACCRGQMGYWRCFVDSDASQRYVVHGAWKVPNIVRNIVVEFERMAGRGRKALAQ